MAALTPASLLFLRSYTYQHCDFLLGLLQLVYLHCSIRPIWPPSANAAKHPTLAFKPLMLFPLTLYLLPLHPHHRLMLLAVSLYLLLHLPLPDFLRIFQWNAGGLQARSTELLHFISSHPVDLICIQESNLNLSFSFRISGFSALRSDGTHSRSGIFSTNITGASGGVIIFVRQGLSFSELSISSLSSLDPYSDYVVNISLNDSFSLLFLNVYAPPICSSLKDSRTNFFLHSSLLSRSGGIFALLLPLPALASTSLLAWFIKITKVAPFESVEVFHKNPFLALYFSLSSLMISLLLCLLTSAALFMLTIWPFGRRPHKEL